MIVFTGDVNLTDWHFNVGFGIGTKIAKGLDPFKYIVRNTEDIWIGNFEGVSSKISTNQGLYANSFRINPDNLRQLHHFDYYGFANNHAMEHGPYAYNETVNALESYGSTVFGLKNKRSCYFKYGENTISLTGLCLRIEESKHIPLYWYNPEYKEIEDELSSLPPDSFKVLFVHWGNEYINRPSSTQIKFAHWLIDSGFDLIIGMHPHVLQGYEDYNGKRIYYSLGNFVFDMPSEQCRIGAVVRLSFNNDGPVYDTQYVKIDNDCCPHIITQNEIPPEFHFEYLNKCLAKEDNSETYHREIQKFYNIYRNANYIQLFKVALRYPFLFMAILKDFIRRRIIKK